jgi:hypothetical protein
MLVRPRFFLSFSAGATVNVGEVERVGLGQAAKVEVYDDTIRGVLEGSGAAHPGVALGVQLELCAIAVVGVVLLALRTATAAPYQQEGSPERHDAEYWYPPHTWEDTIGAGAIHRPNCRELNYFHDVG